MIHGTLTLWWGILVPTLLLGLHAFAILSALLAICDVRTSQAAVAWMVGLILLPDLTLPVYWVFARKRFFGYREAVRSVGRQDVDSCEAIQRETKAQPDTRTTSLATPLDQVAGISDTPICDGNEFHLLIDGEAFFDAMFEQMESAQRYLYAEFSTFRDDMFGNRFADALIARSNFGFLGSSALR